MKTPIRITSAALALSLALAAPGAADEKRQVRTLDGDFPATGVERVDLRMPPGALKIEPSPDGRLHVELGVWCDLDSDRCEERAERLSLESERNGSTLQVRVRGRSMKLHLRGRILVPQGKAIDIDLPAGELTVHGVRADLRVDAGAGVVKVRLREVDVRSVRLGVGVGEATLSVPGRKMKSWGILGPGVRWKDGAGVAKVNVNLIVGELGVILD